MDQFLSKSQSSDESKSKPSNLIGDLANAFDYFRIGEEMLEHREEIEENIDNIEDGFEYKKDEALKNCSIVFKVGKIAAIVLGCYFVLVILMLLDGKSSGNIATDIGTIAAVVFVEIVAIGLMVGSKTALKITKEKYDRLYLQTIKPEVDKLQDEHTKISNAIDEFIDEYSHLIKFLPPQYHNSQATSYMYYSIVSGRADSFKEAMNLYEEQLHRWKLEDAAEQAAEAQRYAAAALDELNARQAETNNHLKAIEFAQYMQFINSSDKR